MSEFSFFSYTDFTYTTNRSQNIVNLPISPFRPRARPSTDEVSPELNIPYTVFEVLVAVFAIVGNLMVIIVFQRERKLRRRTNFYIVSLALADFLVGIVGIPFAILASIGLPRQLHACLFTVSLLVVLCTISIFCLVAVSVDRYWAILYPMAYSRNVRTKTAIIIISMCWVAGTLVGLLPLFGWHADVDSENQACLFVEVMDYDYLVFLYFATIITPALLMLAFYAHIYRVIIKQVRQIVTMNPMSDYSRQSSTSQVHCNASPRLCHGTMLRVLGAARKRDVKATQNLSIIVLFFMICWIPLYTINCIQAFCPSCTVPPKLTLFCIILSHLNSAVNPVLYAYHLKDFRAALKNLVLKLMGIDVERPGGAVHRFSMPSQHRLQSLDASIRHGVPRIYIDSPIWLRQQQQQSLKMPTKCDIICGAGSNGNQTAAAVASATSEIEREIWNIMEASSGAEKDNVVYSFPQSMSNSSTSPPMPPPRRHRKQREAQDNESNQSPYSYENRNYVTSTHEDDYSNDESDFDEVFLPNRIENNNLNVQQGVNDGEFDQCNELSNSTKVAILRGKLHSDSVDSQGQYSLPITYETIDDTFLQNDTIEAPEQSYKPSAQQSDPHKRASLCSRTSSAKSTPQHLRASSSDHNNSIFVIEKDTSLLSPGHKPKFKKASTGSTSINSNGDSKGVSRSCSCSSDVINNCRKLLKQSSIPDSKRDLYIQHYASNRSPNNHVISNNVGDISQLNISNCKRCHCAQQRSNHTHYLHNCKFSPVKTMSELIFTPIAKHSSLFHLFDSGDTRHSASLKGVVEDSQTNSEKTKLNDSRNASTATLVTEVVSEAPPVLVTNNGQS